MISSEHRSKGWISKPTLWNSTFGRVCVREWSISIYLFHNWRTWQQTNFNIHQDALEKQKNLFNSWCKSFCFLRHLTVCQKKTYESECVPRILAPSLHQCSWGKGLTFLQPQWLQVFSQNSDINVHDFHRLDRTSYHTQHVHTCTTMSWHILLITIAVYALHIVPKNTQTNTVLHSHNNSSQ